ncbi:MAG: hypothetical protein RL661_864 [Pseudomonadota bacterium]|jgi:hypothetical protein
MNWTEYNSTTGQMGGVHSGYQDAESALSQIFMAGMDAVIEGEYDNRTHYILNGQPTERPASPVTIDGRTLSDVPPGSTLWIDGESYEAEGDVELDFAMPGTYKLRVVCFPYLDWEYDLVML